MRPPLLNRKLVLEEAQRLPDGAGGHLTQWVALGALWAALDAGSGREIAGEGVTLSSNIFRITVRAAPFGAPSRPRPEQRFRDGARLFRILAVSEADAEARYLTCVAKEEVLA